MMRKLLSPALQSHLHLWFFCRHLCHCRLYSSGHIAKCLSEGQPELSCTATEGADGHCTGNKATGRRLKFQSDQVLQSPILGQALVSLVPDEISSDFMDRVFRNVNELFYSDFAVTRPDKPFLVSEEWGCRFCSQVFSTRKRRLIHEKAHHDSKPKSHANICRFCGYKAPNWYHCHGHELNQHSGEFLSSNSEKFQFLKVKFEDAKKDGLVCSCCNKFFFTKELRWRHENHMQKIYEDSVESSGTCRFCGKAFLHPHCCLTHELTFHSGKILSNQEAYPDLIKEFEERKKAGYVCSCCNKVFRKKRYRIRHEQLLPLRAQFPLKCSWCGLGFVTRWGLLKHEFLMHRNKPDYIPDDAVVKYFNWSHYPENRACRWCNKVYAHADICDRHEKECHSTEPDYAPRMSLMEWRKVLRLTKLPEQEKGPIRIRKDDIERSWMTRRSSGAVSEVLKLKQMYSREKPSQVDSRQRAGQHAPKAKRSSSLLEWDEGLNQVLVDYLTGQQRPSSSSDLKSHNDHVVLMNFSRSAVPQMLLDEGLSNLHLFDANVDLYPEYPGYERFTSLQEKIGVHQMSLARIPYNWSLYEGSPDLKNQFEETLTQSSVTWDMFNSSTEVLPDTKVVGFLNRENLIEQLVVHLLRSCIQQSHLYCHGPVTLLTFLTPRLYGLLMGYRKSYQGKCIYWNMQMAMDIRVVHMEPETSIQSPRLALNTRSKKMGKNSREELEQHHVCLNKLYLTEFRPKRDSELVFGGVPIRRIDGAALLFLQHILGSGLSIDKRRTALQALEPWVPEAAGALADLNLAEKKIRHYEADDLAALFEYIILPHIAANEKNQNDAFVAEYHNCMAPGTHHDVEGDISEGEIFTGRLARRRMRLGRH